MCTLHRTVWISSRRVHPILQMWPYLHPPLGIHSRHAWKMYTVSALTVRRPRGTTTSSPTSQPSLFPSRRARLYVLHLACPRYRANPSELPRAGSVDVDGARTCNGKSRNKIPALECGKSALFSRTLRANALNVCGMRMWTKWENSQVLMWREWKSWRGIFNPEKTHG